MDLRRRITLTKYTLTLGGSLLLAFLANGSSSDELASSGLSLSSSSDDSFFLPFLALFLAPEPGGLPRLPPFPLALLLTAFRAPFRFLFLGSSWKINLCKSIALV